MEVYTFLKMGAKLERLTVVPIGTKGEERGVTHTAYSHTVDLPLGTHC